MTQSFSLTHLLQRAGSVFSQAGELGRILKKEHKLKQKNPDPESWLRHYRPFCEFQNRVSKARNALEKQDDVLKPVAKLLVEAERICKTVLAAMELPDARISEAYLECFPQLISICKDGTQAVAKIKKSRKLHFPNVFLDEPTFSSLDRFPATAAGHIKFLEFVRDEVQAVVEAKCRPLPPAFEDRKGPMLDSMIRGIKWVEAGERLTALSHLLDGIPPEIDDVLNRELTVGTVDDVFALLVPAVRSLRESVEQLRRHDSAKSAPRKIKVTAATEANGERPVVPDSQVSTPKRRGRKKADYDTVQKEAALAAEWKRAREADVYKLDFAKENGMNLREFDDLLNRVGWRKRNSK